MSFWGLSPMGATFTRIESRIHRIAKDSETKCVCEELKEKLKLCSKIQITHRNRGVSFLES